MKITDLWYLIAWLTSGGLTYWLVMETNGNKLKKENPTIYNSLVDNSTDLKAQIATTETELANLKSKYETEKQKVEAMAEGEAKETAKEGLKTQEKELAAKQETFSVYQSIDKYGLAMPTLSISNIAKSLGTFLLLGLIIHFIVNKVLQIFKKNND